MGTLITLITDFGTVDEYVGVMKGVMLSINPQLKIVDISHQIEPGDVIQAGRMLHAAYPYFPPETIHVVVVDPGVGSQRAIVAVRLDSGIFVVPDNGVLTPFLDTGQIREMVKVENPEWFRHPVSQTFHGRDKFAPVAAYLSLGRPLANLGPKQTEQNLVRVRDPQPEIISDGSIQGQVIAIDRFGNLITNVDQTTFERFRDQHSKGQIEASIKEHVIQGLADCYQSVPQGEPLLIFGSRDLLEISINRGHAANQLNVSRGDPVVIRCIG